MRLLGREIVGFARGLVILVMTLLIASGLCGVQWAVMTGARSSLSSLEGFFMLTGILELAVMVISVCGILVVLMIWPLAVIYARYAKPKSDEAQRLFDDSDDQNAPG